MSDLPSKMDVDRAVTTMKRTESSTGGSDEIMTVETAPSVASTTSSNRTSEWTAASRPTSATMLQLNRTVTASSDLSSSTTGDDGSSVRMIIERSSSSGVFSSFSDDLSTVEPIHGLLNDAGSSTSTSGAKRKRRRRGRRRSMPRQHPDEGIKDDEHKLDNQEATSSSANRSERQDDDNSTSGESSNTRARRLFAPQKRELHPYALANEILAEVKRTSVNDDDGNFFGSIA